MVIHCNYDNNMQYHYSFACLRNFLWQWMFRCKEHEQANQNLIQCDNLLILHGKKTSIHKSSCQFSNHNIKNWKWHLILSTCTCIDVRWPVIISIFRNWTMAIIYPFMYVNWFGWINPVFCGHWFSKSTEYILDTFP